MASEPEPRVLSHRQYMDVKEGLEWISETFNPSSYSRIKKDLENQEPHLNVISHYMDGDLSNYFPEKEMNDLKIIIDSFHITHNQYKASRGSAKFLMRLALDGKAKEIFEKNKKLLNTKPPKHEYL